MLCAWRSQCALLQPYTYMHWARRILQLTRLKACYLSLPQQLALSFAAEHCNVPGPDELAPVLQNDALAARVTETLFLSWQKYHQLHMVAACDVCVFARATMLSADAVLALRSQAYLSLAQT